MQARTLNLALRIAVSLFFGFLFILLTSHFLFASSETGWQINNFHSEIEVSPNTTVKVTETIKVNFGSLQKHGIFRTIPVKYSTALGNHLNIRLKLLSITDEDGRNLPVKQSKQGKNIEFKIGYPDRTVTGEQTYVLSYQISQVVTQPSQNAELYWNVTGNNWPVEILKASARIIGPPDSIVDTICFTGALGSTRKNCTHSHTDSQADFSSSKLAPGEGLTISTAFKNDAFNWPGFAQKLWWFLQDNWIYTKPLFVLILMTILYWRRGRDKQYKNIYHEQGDVETVPLFQKISTMNIYGPPKDLSAGEVGVLVDEKVQLRDITAVAIDLARRGFFTIKEIEKKGLFAKNDFKLTYQKKSENNLKDFEKEILSLLFGTSRKSSIKLSQPVKSAYKHLETAKKSLYQHLTELGFFAGNPRKVRTIYLVIGILVATMGWALFAPLNLLAANPFGVIFATVTSGLIIIVFSFFMPARTAKGRKALKQVVGLREWIRLGAWREQIHERHNFFEEVLPYAIAFGLTDKFIKAFKTADLKNLSWYQSSRPITVSSFSRAINSIGPSLNRGVASTRPRSASSGGSGFSGGGSGGGFGGGGGGSW